MKDGPVIATIAALIGDPARANMLTVLMEGRALTVSELATAAGVTIQTASGHLSKMESASLLSVEKQGRHRYYRLSGADIGEVLEGLMGVAQRIGARRLRTGPAEPKLREGRICYDHLAGERGVRMMQSLVAGGHLTDADDPGLTETGRAFFAGLDIDIAALEKGRRPLCRRCLDWSERRAHLGGALGARLLQWMMDESWVRRETGRVLVFSPAGRAGFAKIFGERAPGG